MIILSLAAVAAKLGMSEKLVTVDDLERRKAQKIPNRKFKS